MDISRGQAIPDAFWKELEEKHGVQLGSDLDVYLAIAGWTWARIEDSGEMVGAVSAEDDGYVVIPADMRSGHYGLLVGYC